MMRYDPEVAPDADDWLELDEQERIHLVEQWHRKAREKLPNVTAHAAIQVVVENQIAGGLESVVRAMERLDREGLTRHDALHAIGSCVVDHMFLAMNQDPSDAIDPQARYDAAVDQLTAEAWRHKYDEE